MIIELIETLWNVNHDLVFCYAIVCVELIETLWNVNATVRRCKYYYRPELIETLWNVNDNWEPDGNSNKCGINRNIVECKCRKNPLHLQILRELIETLWNVNQTDRHD